jgi:signal transduction histidine kinase
MRGTLSFRIGAILLAGFVMMQLLLFVALQWPERIDDRGFYGLPSPPAFAELVRAVEASGPEGGKRLVENFDGSLFSVELRHAPLLDFRELPQSMRALALAYRRALPDHNVVVDGGPRRFNGLRPEGARPLRFFVPIRLTIWLRDGDVLVLTGQPAGGLRAHLVRRARIGLVGSAVLLLLLWLALRQTTEPLLRLTRGVQAVGEDLHADDVRPEGSREVRTLARAFNDMKHRIARLVDERTFILAGIAHDMRTYLTRLRLRVEMIADDEQRARAVRDVEQMSSLLDDNLLFAGIDRTDIASAKPIDLAALTRDLADVRIDTDRIRLTAAEPAPVMADPAGLERIFGNLVDNALRHAAHVHVSVIREGDMVLWRFDDDGPGVPAGQLAQLGRAYARLDPSRDRRTGGAGLGLAIVTALAGTMGGTVGFKQSGEGGLTVLVRLRAG